MNRLVCVPLLLLVLTSASAADISLDLTMYVERYVTDSSQVSDQLEQADTLRTELESARIRKDSALSIELAQIELKAATMQVREIENTVVRQAVSLYTEYVRAFRDSQDADAALSIAEREYTVVQNRFRADEQTERDVLNGRISLLQARRNAESASYRLSQARNDLLRPLALEQAVIENDLSDVEISPVQLDIDTVKEHSADYYLARETEALRQREYALKSESVAFTREEMELLEDRLEDAADSFQSAAWDIEDSLSRLENDLMTYAANLEIAQANLTLARIDLESTSLKYEYGEVLETEVESGRRQVRRAENELVSLGESLFQIRLEALDLAGGRLVSAVSDAR